MKTVSAREANHDFSELLSRVERTEQILITKRSKPVALLSPQSPAAADTGTAGGYRACNQRDGTRLTLGHDPENFHAR